MLISKTCATAVLFSFVKSLSCVSVQSVLPTVDDQCVQITDSNRSQPQVTDTRFSVAVATTGQGDVDDLALHARRGEACARNSRLSGELRDVLACVASNTDEKIVCDVRAHRVGFVFTSLTRCKMLMV